MSMNTAHNTDFGPGLVAHSVMEVAPAPVVEAPLQPAPLVLLPAQFDPAPNDAIKWPTGKYGVVLQVVDSWMEPDEVYVCVDIAERTNLTAKKRLLGVEELEATHETFDGRRVLKFVG